MIIVIYGVESVVYCMVGVIDEVIYESDEDFMKKMF